MAKAHPQEVRDRLLGLLYRRFPGGMLLNEIMSESGAEPEAVKAELIHLLSTKLVRYTGQDLHDDDLTREFLIELLRAAGSNPMLRFSISAEGRERVEERFFKPDREKKGSKVSLGPIGEAEGRRRARNSLDSAMKAAALAASLSRHGSASSVHASQEAIEFAAKAVISAAGFEAPLEHRLGESLQQLIERVSGEPNESIYCKRTIARMVWQSNASAELYEASKYGIRGEAAADIFEYQDAERWRAYADEVTARVSQLLAWIDQGKVRFSR